MTPVTNGAGVPGERGRVVGESAADHGGEAPNRVRELRMPFTAPAAALGDQLEVRLPDGTVLRDGRVADVVALVRALRS